MSETLAAAAPEVSVEVSVRPLAAADVVAVAALFRREAELHQRLAGSYQLVAGFDWPAFVRQCSAAAGRRFLVAERGGQLAGFLYLRTIGRPPPPSPKRRSWLDRLRRLLRRRRPALDAVGSPLRPLPRGVIEDCLVRPSHRRRGVGRALVEAALAASAADGVGRVELGVLSNNAPARAFWEALGFEVFRLSMCLDGRHQRETEKAYRLVEEVDR